MLMFVIHICRKDNSSIVMHLVMYALFDGNEKCGRLSDGINGTVYVHVVVLHSASNGVSANFAATKHTFKHVTDQRHCVYAKPPSPTCQEC